MLTKTLHIVFPIATDNILSGSFLVYYMLIKDNVEYITCTCKLQLQFRFYDIAVLEPFFTLNMNLSENDIIVHNDVAVNF